MCVRACNLINDSEQTKIAKWLSTYSRLVCHSTQFKWVSASDLNYWKTSETEHNKAHAFCVMKFDKYLFIFRYKILSKIRKKNYFRLQSMKLPSHRIFVAWYHRRSENFCSPSNEKLHIVSNRCRCHWFRFVRFDFSLFSFNARDTDANNENNFSICFFFAVVCEWFLCWRQMHFKCLHFHRFF